MRWNQPAEGLEDFLCLPIDPVDATYFTDSGSPQNTVGLQRCQSISGVPSLYARQPLAPFRNKRMAKLDPIAALSVFHLSVKKICR